MRSAAAEGTPYTLVIIDQQMSEKDGLTLAREIKADPALSEARKVLMTVQGIVDNQALTTAGIDAYLAKPVKQALLLGLLVGVSGKEKSRRKLGLTNTPELPALPPLRILLAEDNQVNQKVAVGLLRKIGFPLAVVADGQEVLEALAHTPYDVILMDCHMPEMDGYEAAEAIRRREKTPDCPWKAPVYIIALTADAMHGDREKCLAAGMNDYLTKPMQLAVLHAALSRCLSLDQKTNRAISAV